MERALAWPWPARARCSSARRLIARRERRSERLVRELLSADRGFRHQTFLVRRVDRDAFVVARVLARSSVHGDRRGLRVEGELAVLEALEGIAILEADDL